MPLIRRSDIIVYGDGVTPEPGVLVTVLNYDGTPAIIYDDASVVKTNPVTSGIDGSFYYNVLVSGTYIEEYRLYPDETPRRVIVLPLGTTGTAAVYSDLIDIETSVINAKNAAATSAAAASVSAAAAVVTVETARDAALGDIDAAGIAAAVDAEAARDLAIAAKADAEFAAISSAIPVGWVEPSDYTEGAWYAEHFPDLKFWANGYRIYTMLPYGGTTRSEWLDGGIFETFPDDGLLYASVDLSKVYDPTLQGTAAVELHVNFVTGNDTTGDGSAGLPYKLVSKARTVAEAAAETVFEIIIHVDGPFLGNSCFGTGTRTLSKNIKYRNANPEKWWMPGVRETNTLAAWAWTDLGDGVFISTGSGLASTNALLTAVVFDLSVLDSDGAPTPSNYLVGPYADAAAAKAAILAAGRPSFHYSATFGLVVQLASGDEPDPGVNFGYTEIGSLCRFSPADSKMLMFEDFKLVHGIRTSNIDGISFRAGGVPGTLNGSTPYTNHHVSLSLSNVTVVGPSANAFDLENLERSVLVNCRDFYCWLDGVNETNLYKYPASSSGTTQGDNDHCFIDRHISKYHGPGNGQRDAPAVNASANAFTGHVRGRTTVISSFGRGSNGSSVAYVTGAKCLSIGNNISGPKPVTPATDTYTAAFLASSPDDGVNEGARILSLYDAGYVRGADSATHYAGNEAIVAVEQFRGSITIEEVGTGQVVDGSGNAL